MKPKIKLKNILASQKFAILATISTEGPYQNIVAFAETKDLKRIIFATPRETSKYKNLIKNPNISLFIDDRTNSDSDLGEAAGVCALGYASELTEKSNLILRKYLQKHPTLNEFASSPSTVLFSMCVSKYLIVFRFQNVVEIIP